jgi:hypothetical protein
MDPWRQLAPDRVSSSGSRPAKAARERGFGSSLGRRRRFHPLGPALGCELVLCVYMNRCELMVCVYVNWCCVLIYELMVLCVDVRIFNDVLLYELMFPFV